MSKNSMAAIIVAGGRGERMGANCPKQYLEIDGKEIIQHTLNTFNSTKLFEKIVVVCHESYFSHIQNLIQQFGSANTFCVARAGATRQESVYNGLIESKDCEYVMIHDAVRCCVTKDDITKLAHELKNGSNCALGVKVNDTIKLSDSDNNIIKTVDRQNLWHIQTPQAFKTDVIISAHIRAKNDGFAATDDCALAERDGICVKIVEGSYSNIKITTPADLVIAREYLKGR